MEISSIILNLEALAKSTNSSGKISFATSSDSSTHVEMEISLGRTVFLKMVIEAINQSYCILLSKDSRLNAEGVVDVLRVMRDCDADMAIAQVEDSEGRRSLLPRRMEDLRFSSIVPIGAVIFKREHFIRTIQRLPALAWDSWWYFDLVRMGANTGLVCLSNRVVTKSRQPLADFSHAESLVSLRREVTSSQPAGEPIILVYGGLEASVSLYFEGLPADLQRQIRFYSPCDPISDLPHLAAASAIIIVRDFEYMATNGLLELLDVMDVPLFWFTDDHLESLRPEYPAFRYYDSAAMKSFLSRVRGILVSSPTLVDIYRKMHASVTLWPLVFDETLAAQPFPETGPPGFRLGAFGGDFRRDSLRQDVMPAIRKLQVGASTSLYLRSDLARGIETGEAVSMPFDSSYRQFVFRWQQLQLNAVVHPFGATRNILYKSFGSLLTARYLGAIPLVAAESIQQQLGEEEGVLVTDRGTDSWEKSLQRVRDPESRRQLFGALDAWCRNEFNPEKSREPFSHLTQMLPAEPIDAEKRLSRALSHPRVKQILFPEPAPPPSPSIWEKLFKRNAPK